jgi:hypothetical protein
LGQAASTSQPSLAKKGKASGLKKFICKTQSSKEDDDDETVVTHTDPSRPWYASFKNYIDAVETKPPLGMSAIQWWGVSTQLSPSLLATDWFFVVD